MANDLYGYHVWGYALCVFGHDMKACDGMGSLKVVVMLFMCLFGGFGCLIDQMKDLVLGIFEG